MERLEDGNVGSAGIAFTKRRDGHYMSARSRTSQWLLAGALAAAAPGPAVAIFKDVEAADAPTGGNMQPLSIIVVREPERRAKLGREGVSRVCLR